MKAYVKPELFYESFELSQHIALCAWDMSNSTDKQSCSALGDEKDFGMIPAVIFVDGNTLCNDKPEDYCYTKATNGIGVFNS